jgi:hypothetical protein
MLVGLLERKKRTPGIGAFADPSRWAYRAINAANREASCSPLSLLSKVMTSIRQRSARTTNIRQSTESGKD